MLDDLPGVGEVTARKLLARKRPLLIPVVDSVIVEALGCEKNRAWETLREAISDDIQTEAETLRPPGCRVSTLRLIDTAVWMRCSGGVKARSAQRTAGPDSGLTL